MTPGRAPWCHVTSVADTAAVHPGHRPGTGDYRRVVAALFAAGLATFALLYDTQAVLPELVTEYGVSPTRSTLTVSLTTVGLALAVVLVLTVVARPASVGLSALVRPMP